MQSLEGGYVVCKVAPILRGINAHTADLDGQPVSQGDLEATNRLMGTAWTVNRGVLQTARDLIAGKSSCPLVPGDVLMTPPNRMGDDAWAAADDATKKKHRVELAKCHAENASRMGKRQAFFDSVDTAEVMEPHNFWFVWTHDFRLRRYPVSCGGLSPQGHDLSKSLMQFRRAKPLGSTGLYWLCVRAANTFGHDKLPLDDRFGWAMDNAALFESIARNPARFDLWAGAEEPWGFLATAIELGQAFASGRPEDFESHLPVPMDGSCNGLQHLSAMGLDPVGALATNLCASDERHDVYLAVAEHARKRVEADAAKMLPEAMAWMGHVNRDAVKRAVLATPYGVTDEGIRRQLVSDGKVPSNDDVSQKDSSGYFRDVLVDALSGTVVAAKQIMAWLQTCSFRLAEAGLPMAWETPMGSTCLQAYKARSSRRVRTLVGNLVLMEEVQGGGFDAKKQALGSSPQVVHSFDAAHLAATVNSMGRHHGIEDFAMIHDSFGTHAADTQAMHAVLRQTFVEQYQVNRLELLAEGFKVQAPHVDIPPPPARGTFDLAANVPSSRFFFA